MNSLRNLGKSGVPLGAATHVTHGLDFPFVDPQRYRRYESLGESPYTENKRQSRAIDQGSRVSVDLRGAWFRPPFLGGHLHTIYDVLDLQTSQSVLVEAFRFDIRWLVTGSRFASL
jgi:hypothetical protein